MEVQHPKKITSMPIEGKSFFFHKESRARFWRRKSKLKIWGGKYQRTLNNIHPYFFLFLGLFSFCPFSSFPFLFLFLLKSFPKSIETIPGKYGTLYNPYYFFISEYIIFLGSPCSSSCEALKDDFTVNKITTCINHMFSRLLLKQ